MIAIVILTSDLNKSTFSFYYIDKASFRVFLITVTCSTNTKRKRLYKLMFQIINQTELKMKRKLYERTNFFRLGH